MAGPNPDTNPGGDFFKKIFDEGLKTHFDKFLEYVNTNFDETEIRRVLGATEVSATNVLKTFGAGRERLVDLRSSMSDAVASVVELGGEFSNIENAQLGVSQALKRNVVLTSDSFREIYALSTQTNKEISTVVTNFKDVGISVYQMGDKVNEALAVSAKLGVNANEVIDTMLNNMSALNKFNFEGGTEGLARMAAHATSLRFDMKETLNLAEKVFNPEGAIQVAAAMQRLGVAQSDLLDPLRLMDLSQNDPEELQKQLEQMSKSFVKMKADGTFEILPGEKRRLREIEDQLGMTQGSLAKLALSSKEVDEKMKKIRFGDEFSEEQQRFIASISEIGKGGDMRIRLDGENLGIDQALERFRETPEKLKELMKPKTAEDLAKDQLTTLGSIDASLKTLKNRTGYAMAGTPAVTEFENAQRRLAALIPRMGEAPGLKTEDIRKDLFGTFEQMLTDVSEGKTNMKDFAIKFSEKMETYGNKLGKFPEHTVEVISKLDTSSNRFLKLGEDIIGLTKELKSAGFPSLTAALKQLIKADIPKPNSAEGKDFELKLLPMDTVKLVGGTHESLREGGTSMPTKMEIQLTHKVEIDTTKSPQLNTSELKQSLKTADVADAVRRAVEDSMKSFGKTGKQPLLGNDTSVIKKP